MTSRAAVIKNVTVPAAGSRILTESSASPIKEVLDKRQNLKIFVQPRVMTAVMFGNLMGEIGKDFLSSGYSGL